MAPQTKSIIDHSLLAKFMYLPTEVKIFTSGKIAFWQHCHHFQYLIIHPLISSHCKSIAASYLLEILALCIVFHFNSMIVIFNVASHTGWEMIAFRILNHTFLHNFQHVVSRLRIFNVFSRFRNFQCLFHNLFLRKTANQCLFMWRDRWSLLENALSQCGHLNGLSPVCLR